MKQTYESPNTVRASVRPNPNDEPEHTWRVHIDGNGVSATITLTARDKSHAQYKLERLRQAQTMAARYEQIS